MNLFKNMLFLQGYLADPREAMHDEAAAFEPRYGNRVESERRFAPLGHGTGAPVRRAPVAPVAPVACGGRG